MLKNKSVKKDSALARVLAQRTGKWLGAHIDTWIESKSGARYDPGWFHPSALGNPCDAFLAFAYMGTEAKGKSNSRGLHIMDNGTSRHIDWSRYLVKSGVSLFKYWEGKKAKQERSFEIPQLRIRGECDDAVTNPLTKEKYIFEFKTMNKDAWEALTEPKSDHIMQVHPYMFGFGILQAVIVYENKNNQQRKEFVVKFDQALWRSIEARVLSIIEQVERKKLPWRTPLPNDSQCQFYSKNATHSGCAAFTFKEE